ncbi:MAG TPA: putative sulfate exporter family transporter [Steroidobacteraceae bacterium]|nr:putative sulfate exporter family transporter [Steroidobacteraceae bacterium]
MTEAIHSAPPAARSKPSSLPAFARTEDWWSILIGLGLVLAAAGAFAGGASIKWLAVAPQKWSELPALAGQLRQHATQYLALFVLWAALLGLGATALGYRFMRFVAAFAALFVVALGLYATGQWDQAAHYNLEPPLVALALGLLVSNTVGTPGWLQPALRVEFYIKTGIVLLGAGLPLTLIVWGGSVAIVQAAIVSLVTFGVIYFVATRLGLDRRFAAILGTGGAVCGVSGAIAAGGAVGARKEHVSVAIALVILWAIATIFILPLAARALLLPTGIAGAWIGTSEFADAAGLAAAQAYGGYAGTVPGIAGTPDAAVNAFTLMKVIGRDVWIGVWAFALSVIAATRWESTGVESGAGAAQIWRRFPKFVLGFIAASAVITLVSRGYTYPEYKKALQPALVAPLQALRVWAFTFAFLSIGLTTRLRELLQVGARPFYAFTAGVAVNIALGYFLSTQVFAAFWGNLGL